MKAKNSLNPDAVVASALRIVDEQGLDALTVRKVADEFGVTPMALYWHFSNKEALLDAVGDAVVASLVLPDATLDLETYLSEAMTSLVDVLRAHPNATPLVPTRLLLTEAGREITERTLDKLVAAGLTIAKAAAVDHYALTIALTLVAGEPGAETSVRPDERDQARVAKLALLKSLSQDRYPYLMAAAPSMVVCGDSDDYYETAIEIFVKGVMTQVSPDPAG